MKITKKQAAYAVIAALISILALVLTILEAQEVFVICSHPVFMFFFALTAGLGILLTVQGILEKSPFRLFLASFLIVYALSYALADFAHLAWWLIVIIAAVTLILFLTVSFLRAGSKTEAIALNKYPEYKNYEQRKAEREEKEKAEEESYVPPEIKSFKDEDK